ncbi:MAG TPA: hypothetical protein VHH36_07485 [Candidatus Thermoplasmatota archaeon]|nr:hypothetical protein [Candidatus Thermoplasmatota archaeon]
MEKPSPTLTINDLARRGAISVLAELGRKEKLTMRDFTTSSSLVADRAKILREELRELGLIDVRIVYKQGALELYEISLTPLGRAVAKHLVAVADVLEGAGAATPKAERAARAR